jgi:hypothetical protein
MSQYLTESFVTSNVPGSFFDVKVKSTPVGTTSSGNIVIIGEAEGGAATFGVDSTDGDILKNNYYTPDQADRVTSKYISGNIVDAMRSFSAPSADAGITGGPSRVYIAKTNLGTKASRVVDSAYGTFKYKNYGPTGDKYYYQITSSQAETPATVTSSAITYTKIAEVTRYIAEADVAGSLNNKYVLISSPTVSYYIWFNINGAGVDPAVAGRTGIEATAATDATAIAIADAMRSAITAHAPLVFSFDVAGSATINITNLVAGVVLASPTLGNTGWSTPVAIPTPGDDADGSVFNGLSFTARINGGAGTVVTLSSTESNHDTVAELAAEIDALLPSGLSCAASTTHLVFSCDTLSANAAQALSYGRSFELIDSNPGDLAAIGCVAALTVASAEPEVQVDINRQDTNLDEEFIVGADIGMLIGYAGTTATMTISGNTMTTTVVGGSGTSLTIDLTTYSTIKVLADFINSQTGYTCSVTTAYTQKSPTALDKVTAVGICSTASSVTPGRIKASAYNFALKVGQSTALDFIATATVGLPNSMAAVAYLSGGTKGATTAANIVSAINDLRSINVNFVIPLFSRDASADIADALTDAASTYTIDALNALVKSHVLSMSTAKLKRHRLAICSYWGTYATTKTKASALAHYRLSMCFQKSTQINSAGLTTSFLPWYTACVAAGMKTAGFYKGFVNKYANVISYTDPSGFDSGDPGDKSDAIDAGLLFLEADNAGNKWVCDQTTYSIDTNFIYNSLGNIYNTDLVTLDLADSFQKAYTGQSLADVDAGTALAFLGSKMAAYKTQKLITASDDAPLGFKNSKISINGAVMSIKTEVKISTSILFEVIEVEISEISSSASQ